MKNCRSIFFVALLLTFSCSIPAAQGQNIHVLVNIWDGAEMAVVGNLYNQGELPFLSAVGPIHNLTCNTDCFNGICMKTLTKSHHATMLRGCLADVHGVYTNVKYQLIPDGMTVYELIESANPEYRTAHISGKGPNVGKSTFGNIIEDVDIFDIEICPSVATDMAIDLINQWKDQSFFIVCHFRKPDRNGHLFGINSTEYRETIKVMDSYLGELLAALDANNADAETVIYVLSDHGFGCPLLTNHKCSPNTFIATNNANLTGDIFMKDVARKKG
jgi:hypothetical protein